ncbi:VQ motif-containing protein [Quillaja saponaria]|uniref:VQ motif-containing protein n=1 Tax=Quillaja saponaria TaxID=32244 RepID=A0AAD7L9T2_QUISA|nr:VQ motif-containing protein [Quillaja saponaria]
MSPAAKFHEQSKKEMIINGTRLSPLKIHRESHIIQKSSSSNHQQQRKPIIIYTHSPKIIHTQARDFMALVQKLTGMSRSNVNQSSKKSPSPSASINNIIVKQEQVVCDDNNLTIEESSRTGGARFQMTCQFFEDLRLFTPNSREFFCSPRPVFRFSDSPYGNMGSLISPSGLEFMKGLPEY